MTTTYTDKLTDAMTDELLPQAKREQDLSKALPQVKDNLRSASRRTVNKKVDYYHDPSTNSTSDAELDIFPEIPAFLKRDNPKAYKSGIKPKMDRHELIAVDILPATFESFVANVAKGAQDAADNFGITMPQEFWNDFKSGVEATALARGKFNSVKHGVKVPFVVKNWRNGDE